MVPSDREILIVIWLLEDITHDSYEEIEQDQKEYVYAEEVQNPKHDVFSRSCFASRVSTSVKLTQCNLGDVEQGTEHSRCIIWLISCLYVCIIHLILTDKVKGVCKGKSQYQENDDDVDRSTKRLDDNIN